MDSITSLKQLRLAMMAFAKTAPDEEAYQFPSLFDAWAVGVAYAVDSRVQSGDKLWKCLQPHTSQEGWNPEASPALWVEVAKPGEYREIKTNMLPTEAFDLDEIGWYKGKDNLFKSKIPNNTYTPDTYPDGWEVVE